MSLKLKALGLGVLAIMATSAFAVMNATATTGGHFVTNGVSHAVIDGKEEGSHVLEFTVKGVSGGIICTTSSYEGTTETETATQVKVTPKWSNCHTTGSVQNFDVHENGCYFTFTVAKGNQQTTEQTADLVCPTSPIVITHPNCTITVPAVNNVTGITYTEEGVSTPHGITMDVSSSHFPVQFHGGICIFLGTPKEGTMSGSVTVTATNTNNEKIDVTAT